MNTEDKLFDVMVDAFLKWKLPADFNPDGGITFAKNGDQDSPLWPVGTNLLTAVQAKEMFKACMPPHCFGDDDCSSNLLLSCKFADKCGAK